MEQHQLNLNFIGTEQEIVVALSETLRRYANNKQYALGLNPAAFLENIPNLVKVQSSDEKLQIVTVYLDANYSRNIDMRLSISLTRQQIIDEVNRVFGKEGWYSFDINHINNHDSVENDAKKDEAMLKVLDWLAERGYQSEWVHIPRNQIEGKPRNTWMAPLSRKSMTSKQVLNEYRK